MSTFTQPLATITLTVSATVPLIADIYNYWLIQSAAIVGNPPVLTTPVSDTDTSIQLDKIAVTLYQQGSSNFNFNQVQPTTSVKVNDVLNVEGEAVTVTAITPPAATGDPYTITIARGTTQVNAASVSTSYPFATPAAHAQGASVSILTYASPWDMANQLWLQPGAIKAQQSLGPASAVFQTSASGSVAITGG